MSGLSRVEFGKMEQLTSTDLEAGFRLSARDVLDALRYLAGDRGVVLGGLVVSAHPLGVSVSPGMLIGPYAGGPGAPAATLDSPYVLGRLSETTTVALPAPPTDTWRLIQARPREVPINGDRLKFDPATGDFTPIVTVVRREQQIEIAYKEETPYAIPVADPGWVPLAAVRSRANITATQAADVTDLRLLMSSLGAPSTTERFEAHDYAVTSRGTDPSVWFDVVVTDPKGRRRAAEGTFTLSKMLAETTVVAPSTWLYVYLAPFGTGRLVVSTVAPSEQGGRRNSALLPPSSLSGAPVDPGEATCIGALRTEGTAGHLVPQSCVDGYHSFGRLGTIGAAAPANPSLMPNGWLPRNARRARFHLANTNGGITAGTIASPSSNYETGPLAVPAAYSYVSFVGPGSMQFSPFPLIGVDTADIDFRLTNGADIQLLGVEL